MLELAVPFGFEVEVPFLVFRFDRYLPTEEISGISFNRSGGIVSR